MSSTAKTEPRPTGAECPGCGKRIALRKDGLLREHLSRKPEWPGSPFRKRCECSGTLPIVAVGAAR